MKKILLIVLFMSVIIGICILLAFFILVPDIQNLPSTKDELVFAKHGDLKKRNEGNEATVVISKSPNLKSIPDTSSEFIYDISSSPLLYKKTPDSLIIYTRRLSGIPVLFRSNVKVSQIELSNPKMMNLIYGKSYIKMGLRKID